MAAKSAFARLSGQDKSSILPFHNPRQTNDYDLDELEPRADDRLLSTDYYDHDPSTQHTSKPFSSNLKPTGARNRRPSNASSAGSASKNRRGYPSDRDSLPFRHGIPPPIAVSRILYHDEEQQQQRYYNDDQEEATQGMAASWLPGTAVKALTSVFGDARSKPSTRQDYGENQTIVYDRNVAWKGLARRERALRGEVERFLQVLEEMALKQGGSDDGSATPMGVVASPSSASSRNPGRSVSFLEPEWRSGPNREIIPVRQPRQKKIGLNEARMGILRCMGDFADIKAEEDALLAAGLSNRKQALVKLRQLASRQQGIVEELEALEMNEEEPSKLKFEDLDNEHRGVCTEIQDLEKRLQALRTRKRSLEHQMDEVKNQREAGLSGYKNALREVEDTVKDFLARPPVKPLDLEIMNENNEGDIEQPASPGGVEFMHLRPGRRTTEMAREWWEAEVGILEDRKMLVDKERCAYDEGGQIWDETVKIVHQCEKALRKNLTASIAASDGKGKGKGISPEMSRDEALKRNYEEIAGAVTDLEELCQVVAEKDWKLLHAAIGIELWAFKEAKQTTMKMMQDEGTTIDEKLLATPAVPREESGTTGSHNSFHSVDGGSELLDLRNNHEDEADDSDDNEVPRDLMTANEHEEERGSSWFEKGKGNGAYTEEDSKAQTAITSFDGEHSYDNEIPPEFLAEVQEPQHHVEHISDNEVPLELLVEQQDHRE